MISLNDRTVQGETVSIDQKSVYFLGPNLTLRDCTVVIAIPGSDLILAASRFESCRIGAKKKLSGVTWHNVFFSGCSFAGVFHGCEFGHTADGDPGGGLERCDFSEATLDTCGFHNVDVADVTFPAWPGFTVIQPRAHAAAIQAAPWPGKSRVVGEVLAECEPEITAVSYDASAVAKRYSVSEDALRTAVSAISDVRL